MDKITYKTTGVCSDLINVQIENNTIVDIEFIGGCNGNLKGIVSLCKGMDINQVIKKLKGIKCNSKETKIISPQSLLKK